jgi:CRP-like cAMP-binding protein
MEAFQLVLEEVEMQSYSPGEAIVREGEVGDSMYSIVQGEVRVLRHHADGTPREVARMHDSDFFGEMALATDGPRLATVEAVTDTIVLVFSRQKLEAVIKAHPSVQSAISRFYRERLLANLLRSNQLFQPLSDEDKAALSLSFQARGARKGTLILKQGQKPDAFFLLLRGRLSVTHESESGPVPYPDLHEGDIFGELSLIQNQPVSATIRAATACVVLRLPQQVFMERLVANPAVREIIRPLLNERIQRTAQLNAPMDFETPFQV